MASNYPSGAENDSSAPYNEKPKIKVTVYVSLTISRSMELEVSPDDTDNQEVLYDEVQKQIKNLVPESDDWCCDDLTVIKD